MSAPAIVAFDLGTTRMKVAAFDLEGRLLSREMERNREYDGRAVLADGRERTLTWQDPSDWWRDAGELCRALMRRPELAGRQIAAIGLSARAGGFVPIDRAGVPVTASWSDDRHRPQLVRLMEWRKGGAHLSNYAATMVAKLLWLRENDPAAASRVVRLLYAKDWLVYRMTGRAVTDPTSGPDAPDFDRASIATLGVDPGLLPEVAPPWAPAGTLGEEGAAHLGLPPGTPVSVGGHDGICANVGAGAGRPGRSAITIGTHAVVRAVTRATPPGAYRFYGLPPDRQVVGGNAVMAGRAADWFLDTWLDRPSEADRPGVFRRMDAEAALVPPGADGARFLPFLSGQVAPEARPGATAGFTGLLARHGRAEMYRAVLEGGAFAIRAIWDQVTGWCGEPSLVRFTGSGALSETWRQIIVDAINHPCDVIDAVAEARGAAVYAAVSAGTYPDVDAAAEAMVHPSVTVEPDPQRAEAYEEIYLDWQRVSDVMRPLDRSQGGVRP